jgi:hypothetical protein
MRGAIIILVILMFPIVGPVNIGSISPPGSVLIFQANIPGTPPPPLLGTSSLHLMAMSFPFPRSMGLIISIRGQDEAFLMLC